MEPRASLRRRSRRKRRPDRKDQRNQRNLQVQGNQGTEVRVSGVQKLNTTINHVARQGCKTVELEETVGQRETDVRTNFIHIATHGDAHGDVRWELSLNVEERIAFTAEEQRIIIAAREVEEHVLVFQQEDHSSEGEDPDDDVFDREEPEQVPGGAGCQVPGGAGCRTVFSTIPGRRQIPDTPSSEDGDGTGEEAGEMERNQQANRHLGDDNTRSWVVKHFQPGASRAGHDEGPAVVRPVGRLRL